MSSIGEVISTIDYSPKNITTIDYRQNNKLNTIDYSKSKISTKEADLLIKQISHLIDDEKYNPFYYKQLYALGADKFKQIALLAEKGRQPARLFAKLLKDQAN